MPIIASPEPGRTEPAYVLRGAADALERLPHPRVCPVDVHLALRDAAGEYRPAQAALEAFALYLAATAGEDRWPYGWTGPRSRVDVVERMRAAAEYGETPAGVTQ